MIKNAIYLLVCFTFIACYSVASYKDNARPTNTHKKVAELPPPDPWETLTETQYMLQPQELFPGEPFIVVCVSPNGSVQKNDPILKATLYNASGKKVQSVPFFILPLDEFGHKARAALMAPSSLAASGNASVKIESSGGITASSTKPAGVVAELPLLIKPKEFIAEVIPLSPSNTSLRTEPDPRKTAESERMWGIISRTGDEIYTSDIFITPVPADTRRSSFYGDRRVYKYSNGKSDTSVHAGIDYAVIVGTEVHAPAAGKVVLATARIVTGNSIIIEHLPALYSIYYHLDSINVKEGDMVNAGELIALSGNTGLSTGPHLHWEIRASTENTDPDALTGRPILDREAILNRLFQKNN